MMEQGVYSRGGGHGDVLTMQNQDGDDNSPRGTNVRFESTANKTKGTLLKKEAQFGDEHFETFNKKYTNGSQQEVEIEANDSNQLKYATMAPNSEKDKMNVLKQNSGPTNNTNNQNQQQQ